MTDEAVLPSAAGPSEPLALGRIEVPLAGAAVPEAAPVRMPTAEPGTSASPSDRWSAREGYLPPSAPDARTNIQLDHPTLGPLSLRVAGEAGRVAVELGASSVAAAVALRTSEAELRRELAGAGAELARFRVRTKSRAAAEDAPTPGTWQPLTGHARRRI
jgi:flagellar hook-length control protein FliK